MSQVPSPNIEQTELAEVDPFIKQGPYIDAIKKNGYLISDKTSRAFRMILRQSKALELGVEFSACDPSTPTGKNAFRLAVTKRHVGSLTWKARLEAKPKLHKEEDLSPAEELEAERATEVKATLGLAVLLRARETSRSDPEIPRGYILVGPLVTASVCEVVRRTPNALNQYDQQIVADSLEQYSQLAVEANFNSLD